MKVDAAKAPALFALGASAAYGAAVATALGLTLSDVDERTFEDGEHKTRPASEVAGRDVFVIASLFGDADESVNDKFVRLLFFIAAVRDAGAQRVVAVCPYLAFSRKDRRTERGDPVTTRYTAALLEASGVDCVVTLDVHNQAAFENAFRCRTVHLDAAELFVAHYAPALANGAVVVVSPDAGGMKRAEAFRRLLETRLGRSVGGAFAEKHRSGAVVTGNALVGSVAGATAVIVDDLVSAGTTLARAAAACRHAGAARVLAAATHGVFAPEADATLADAPLDAIAIADTIVPWRIVDPRLRARLSVVSSVDLVANAIAALHAPEAAAGP